MNPTDTETQATCLRALDAALDVLRQEGPAAFSDLLSQFATAAFLSYFNECADADRDIREPGEADTFVPSFVARVNAVLERTGATYRLAKLLEAEDLS